MTTVQWTGTLFQGQSIPGKTCLVFRKDRQSYLHSEFEIAEAHFRSLDQGRDPETDKVIWGSLSGPFEFVQRENFAQHWDPQLRLEPIHSEAINRSLRWHGRLTDPAAVNQTGSSGLTRGILQ